jgi:dolichyl-phosphate-mannose-protein mannosyltransferase
MADVSEEPLIAIESTVTTISWSRCIVEPAPPAKYRSKFMNDFWHLNVAMYTTNNALVPDPDKDDILASTPAQWPVLETGIRICGWDDDLIKFYLLGNPIVWWAGTASLVAYALLLLWYVLRRQRKYYIAPSKFIYLFL